ncbi:DNA uptake protein ComE-like DNA-binding protein [Neolewinella xylanilytica]|uniref:DNA uptake protein ComE-like DNA-binding protein n=1 Tax=Neolewinella xylanilytica TaxID=1514080 RepID=A0A2S6I6E2_9BACT|nr:helix-hairpin-helix domain-containing protein [Neolewinella xylanilytica]PPK86723.1 DNA uptake protein ComE-like DNA-binding protein [Neolewinella xylanilytica]
MHHPTPNNPWAYTRQQRIGLVALLFLIAVCYGVSRVLNNDRGALESVDDTELLATAATLRSFTPTEPRSERSARARFPFDPNTVSKPDLLRLGLSEKQATAFQRYRQKVRFRRPEDMLQLRVLHPDQARELVPLVRIAGDPAAVPDVYRTDLVIPVERFAFDPNTLPFDSLLLLGLSEREAKGLVNYRSYRPVTFRKPEDLLRVRAIDSLKVRDLMELIRLPASDTVFAPAPAAPGPTYAAGSFDVNRSPAAAWQELPGIGSYRAESIVKFRERLGGFASVEQVAETYGLPDSTYQAIKPYLTASPVNRPLYVNQADAATLSAHPYLKRSTATIIVRYRDNHGPFHSVEDLKKVRAVTTETLDKLLPYLNFAL